MRAIRVCLLFFICMVGVKTACAQNDFLHHKMDSLKLELPQKKTPKDSILVLQQMVEAIGIPDAIKEKIMQPFFYYQTYRRGDGVRLKLELRYIG